MTFELNNKLFEFFRHSRYGIRVDPVQWFIVLTGQDEGAGDSAPSIILLLCMYELHTYKLYV